MQPYALTIDKFLDHAAKWAPERQVVTAEAGVVVARVGYGDLRERCNRLSGALQSLGLGVGDVVGALAWNTQAYFELYYAAMGAGMICHTLNPRLTPAHLAAMINEAQPRVLAVSPDLAPLVLTLAPLCSCLETLITLDSVALDGGAFNGLGLKIMSLETLLSDHGASTGWGDFPEETPAGLCYTSGTTGPPKGVIYTHRSNYLHTLRALQADAFALTAQDVVLVAVPLFHANGWGLPFAGPAVGASLVLPGRHLDGASLARLIRQEGVTVAVGVQTVWQGVADHLATEGAGAEALPTLARVIIGGSHCPQALIERLESQLGARVQTSWGMTELSPLGVIAASASTPLRPRPAGRPLMGLDLKLTDAEGATLPNQRGPTGHLKVKGASVVDRYFKAPADVLDAEGYFDTGDLASLDEAGNLTIRGRSKDLIKSGGEWINPAEIEEIIGRHPDVAQAAVIGRPDPKWGERPVLIVEARSGAQLDPAGLLASLKGLVAAWWMPDEVVSIPAMPLAPTGKIDKSRLRTEYGATTASME
jgi:fatty-acyl-CoA synthase